jgi:hypothetical protein
MAIRDPPMQGTYVWLKLVEERLPSRRQLGPS